MNKAILIGRLTKDPDLRYTPSGTAVSQFTVAVDRRGKDKGADFINIVAWGKDAENVANYCSKGKQVAVLGRISTRDYENNEGKKVYVTEVTAEEVKFLTPSGKSGGGLLEGSTSISSEDFPFDM